MICCVVYPRQAYKTLSTFASSMIKILISRNIYRPARLCALIEVARRTWQFYTIQDEKHTKMTPPILSIAHKSLLYPKFWLFTVLLNLVLLTYLSLAADLPRLELDQGDKWQHITAYFLTMSWFGLVLRSNYHRYSALFLLIYGGFMEVLQALTDYRSFDAWDFVANGSGILLALLLLRWPDYQQLLIHLEQMHRRKNLP